MLCLNHHMKKVLLTVAYIDGLHGSVMHIRELSNVLVGKGFAVTIATLYCDNKLKNIFDKRVIIKPVHDIKDSFFDLIWGYHFPLIGALFHQNVTTRKIIFGCLSKSEILETPPPYFGNIVLCYMLYHMNVPIT